MKKIVDAFYYICTAIIGSGGGLELYRKQHGVFLSMRSVNGIAAYLGILIGMMLGMAGVAWLLRKLLPHFGIEWKKSFAFTMMMCSVVFSGIFFLLPEKLVQWIG